MDKIQRKNAQNVDWNSFFYIISEKDIYHEQIVYLISYYQEWMPKTSLQVCKYDISFFFADLSVSE